MVAHQSSVTTVPSNSTSSLASADIRHTHATQTYVQGNTQNYITWRKTLRITSMKANKSFFKKILLSSFYVWIPVLSSRITASQGGDSSGVETFADSLLRIISTSSQHPSFSEMWPAQCVHSKQQWPIPFPVSSGCNPIYSLYTQHSWYKPWADRTQWPLSHASGKMPLSEAVAWGVYSPAFGCFLPSNLYVGGISWDGTSFLSPASRRKASLPWGPTA